MTSERSNLILGSIAVFLLILISSCSETTVQKKHYETFPVTEVMMFDTTTFVDYTAEITAVQNVEIRARVSGYLEEVHIDEGQWVKEGQLLFSINDLEYAEELSKSKAQYKNSLAEYNSMLLELKNTKQLVEKKVISQIEVDLLLNKVDAAKARVDEALAQQAVSQLKVSNTQIKAPFSGIVSRIPKKMGSLIEVGTLLTSISQNEEVFAYFNISEKEYLNYAMGFNKQSEKMKTVTLILANGKEHEFKGQIETIDGEIDRSTGNIAFRARFKNSNGLLKHGSSGKIRLTRTYDDAIIIPQKATFEIQDKMYVYVLDKDNTVKTRSIVSNARLSHLYIISSGLTVNDKIIFEGIQSMKEGLEINPEFISMKKVLQEISSKHSS